MGEPVAPVIGEVQDQRVEQEGDDRVAEEGGDERFEVRRDVAGIDNGGGELGLHLVEE
jgi:hypothetical protein